MRVVVIGLGVQGRKRVTSIGPDVVATVDPTVPGAGYAALPDVPLEAFDAGCVCTPDGEKLALVRYLLDHGKHVLVEKPLLAAEDAVLRGLAALAKARGVACYTAYNHRFEPNIVRLKDVVESGALGNIYLGKVTYGNGTAMDVRQSPWRDRGMGVLADLGSHLLDVVLFLFGRTVGKLQAWSVGRFENRAWDHVVFGREGTPTLVLEASLVCWKNSFAIDLYGESGSAHVRGLCKWGPSTIALRSRKRPSGRPDEESHTVQGADPTWQAEYEHFGRLCSMAGTNLDNDLWINGALRDLASSRGLDSAG